MQANTLINERYAMRDTGVPFKHALMITMLVPHSNGGKKKKVGEAAKTLNDLAVGHVDTS